jgi:hypothetical protein
MLFVQDRAPSLLGLPTRFLTQPLTYLLALAVAAATVGFSYLSARRGLGGRTLDLEVSLFLLMMFLVAPLSWEHHLVYALPAALFAVDFLLRGRARRPAASVAAVAALLVLAWDFPRDEMYLIKGALAFVNALKFFAAFGLWVFVAWEAREVLRGGGAGEVASADVV